MPRKKSMGFFAAKRATKAGNAKNEAMKKKLAIKRAAKIKQLLIQVKVLTKKSRGSRFQSPEVPRSKFIDNEVPKGSPRYKSVKAKKEHKALLAKIFSIKKNIVKQRRARDRFRAFQK